MGLRWYDFSGVPLVYLNLSPQTSSGRRGLGSINSGGSGPRYIYSLVRKSTKVVVGGRSTFEYSGEVAFGRSNRISSGSWHFLLSERYLQRCTEKKEGNTYPNKYYQWGMDEVIHITHTPSLLNRVIDCLKSLEFLTVHST